MPLPLTVSCFSKIRIVFTFLVNPLKSFQTAHLGSLAKRALNVCVCLLTEMYRVVKNAFAEARKLYVTGLHGSILCDPIQPNPSAD